MSSLERPRATSRSTSVSRAESRPVAAPGTPAPSASSAARAAAASRSARRPACRHVAAPRARDGRARVVPRLGRPRRDPPPQRRARTPLQVACRPGHAPLGQHRRRGQAHSRSHLRSSRSRPPPSRAAPVSPRASSARTSSSSPATRSKPSAAPTRRRTARPPLAARRPRRVSAAARRRAGSVRIAALSSAAASPRPWRAELGQPHERSASFPGRRRPSSSTAASSSSSARAKSPCQSSTSRSACDRSRASGDPRSARRARVSAGTTRSRARDRDPLARSIRSSRRSIESRSLISPPTAAAAAASSSLIPSLDLGRPRRARAPRAPPHELEIARAHLLRERARLGRSRPRRSVVAREQRHVALTYAQRRRETRRPALHEHRARSTQPIASRPRTRSVVAELHARRRRLHLAAGEREPYPSSCAAKACRSSRYRRTPSPS